MKQPNQRLPDEVINYLVSNEMVFFEEFVRNAYSGPNNDMTSKKLFSIWGIYIAHQINNQFE